MPFASRHGGSISIGKILAKEELLEMSGLIAEVLPDSRFRVELDNGHRLNVRKNAATPHPHSCRRQSFR